MATPGELVSIMAAVLGIPQATVVVHDRNLVSAGLRSKGGRGRGAAQVTARDAASLLAAILGSSQVRSSASTVSRLGKTQPLRTPKGYRSMLGGLPSEHSFVDALEAMFSQAVQEVCDLPPGIEIGALSPGTVADIRISGLPDGAVMQVRYALPAKSRLRPQGPAGDFEEYRRVTERTIHAVAKTL